MKTTEERFASARDAISAWFAGQEQLLRSLESAQPLSDEIRTAAAAALRDLPEAQEAWSLLSEEVARQRQQMISIREELRGIEQTVGRVYSTLEEETWRTEPRGS